MVDRAARYLSEPGPIGLFTRLTRVGLFVDAFQHRCLDPFGLKFIDYSVLRVLQAGGAASAGELGEILLRSSGGVTQILDRMEAAGLVRRTADPDDRRKVLAELTDEGLDVAQRASAAYARERRRLLKSLSANEVEQIDAAIRLLLDAFEGQDVSARSPARAANSSAMRREAAS